MTQANSGAIRVNTSNLKDILWLFVFIYMSKLILSPEQQFLFFLGFLVFVIGVGKRIIVPKINGIFGYLLIIAIATVVGFVSFEIRSVYRDLFYYIPTILLMIIGYYLYVMYEGKRDIFKTIMVCALLNILVAIIQLFVIYGMSGDVDIFKDNVSYGLYDNLYILIAMLVFKISDGRIFFNRVIDSITIIAIFAQMGASLYRGVLLSFIASFCLIIVLTTIFSQKGRMVGRIVVYIGAFIVLFMLVAKYVPEEALFSFDEKMDKTTEEINSDQEFHSVEDAMSHWRAFEKQSANTQWKKASFSKQLIGGGMGQKIHIRYIPHNWTKDVVGGGGIAILHSAYHTTLAKCGAIGVLMMIILFVRQLVLGFKNIRKKPTLSIIVIALVASMAIESYVSNGMVGGRANIFWATILGWINAEFQRGRDEVEEQ